MVSSEAYRATITPEAEQKIHELARRVAATHHSLATPVTEQSVSGWIIDERPSTIGEDDYERWNMSEVIILGQDGSLHSGRREQTEGITHGIASDRLTIHSLNIEAWDELRNETYGDDRRQRTWFRSGDYAVSHYGDRVSRALTRFEESGEAIGSYQSPPFTPPPSYNKDGVRSAFTHFVRRCLYLTVGWLIIIAILKCAAVIGSDPHQQARFPAGSGRTIAWSFVFVAIAGLVIDLTTALKFGDRRYRSAADEATPFIGGFVLGLVIFAFLRLNHKVPPGSTGYWWIVPITGVAVYLVVALRRARKRTK
ncbi:hypothetical protein ACFYTQ_26080 [Nocardia sp. NPDC004068]|uniref:hypothetical protein n=1 Tax=Nocardia sp. NPDC004068 TaxID=3364303 RepID=UPI00369239FB